MEGRKEMRGEYGSVVSGRRRASGMRKEKKMGASHCRVWEEVGGIEKKRKESKRKKNKI